jgi:hypothetical protein
MKTWRPFHRGLMIIAPRTGGGRTASGLYVEPGLADRDQTRRVKMVGDVLATYGCERVRPDDVVLFRYGTEHTVIDASGEVYTFVHERHVLGVR